MNTNGLIIAILLMDLAACTTDSPPQAVHSPSTITTPGLNTPSPAPKIEETILSPQQRNIAKGSTVTKDVPIEQSPLINQKTIDCVLTLAIEKECAGFNIDDDN